MNQIKLLRTSQTPKMSQGKLADLVGVERTTVTMWKNGSNEPDNATLIKLAEIFRVTADYLLGRTDQKEQPLTNFDERLKQLDKTSWKIMVYLNRMSPE